MTKPANKTRGEVPLSEAGEGAFLRFTVDSLERLLSEFGEDYFEVVVTGLSKANPKVFRACVEVAINGGDAKGLPWGIPLEQLQNRILDALFLTVYGRTYDEQQKEEDRLFAEKVEQVKTNPRMAAQLSSMLSMIQATPQGSDQTKSDTSPHSKSANSPKEPSAPNGSASSAAPG